MDLNQVLEALAGVSPEQRKELEDLIAPSIKDRVWVPNPGPQTTAFFSEADELFYGGQAGGGKTDLEIGLALTEHKRSLILRRTNNEVKGLLDRMRDIVGNNDGLNSQTGTWRRPDSRIIEMGGCQLETDKQKYKGNPHDLICVGKDTPVLMGNGEYMAVQDVKPGDYVATLEGPRLVKRSFPVYGRESVEVAVNTPEGFVSQVQSASHKVLSRTGWVSLDKTDVAPSSIYVTDAKRYHCLRRSSSNTSDIPSLVSRVLHKISLWARSTLQPRSIGRDKLRLASLMEMTSSTALLIQETDCAEFGGVPRVLSHTGSHSYSGPEPSRHHSYLTTHPDACSSHSHGGGDARSSSLLANSVYDCLAYLRSYGGRTLSRLGLRDGLEPYPRLSHRLDGAAQQNPTRSPEGVKGRTQRHTPHSLEYPHPYGKGTRLSQVPFSSQSYKVSALGKRDLFDLEVDEVNHFITKGGIINKNCFDEVSDFTESQYTFIIAWNRSATPGQRCRVVAAGNPPTRPEGLWVVKRWAAWLDPQHPRPAEPGELRWYTTDNTGEEIEVDGPGPHLIDGRPVYARSRTFIPATLQDNPDLVNSGYQASLDALPAELRAAYRDGDFQTTLKDDAYQIIPTAWVLEAQKRWTPQAPVGIPMCSIGVDVAIAKDKFVIQPRHDYYFPEPLVIPGHEVGDNAKKAAGRVVAMRLDEAKVIVDVGGGWGADCYAQLTANGIESVGYMGVKASRRKSENGKFGFTNVRTEALWRFREALDPSQPGGSQIALPPRATIRGDLCAPTYKVKGHQKGQIITAESKTDVCARLGRSTDEGDAVVMAWWDGVKQHNLPGGWQGNATPGRFHTPQVIKGTRSAYIRRR